MAGHYGDYTDTITLRGDGWAPRTIAFFAGDCLALAVLVPCLLLAPLYKWENNMRRDWSRTMLFALSTIAGILYFALDITNTALTESNTTVRYSYFLLPIFGQLFYRLSELLILLVILRTLAILRLSSSSTLSPGSNTTANVVIGLTALVSAATWGLYAAYYGYVVAGRYDEYTFSDALVGMGVAYAGVYLLASIVLLVLAARALVLSQSRTSRIMIFVTICLVLRALFFLIDVAVLNYSVSSDYETLLNFNVAVEWIYDLATVGIFMGITVVAVMSYDLGLGPSYRDGVEVGQYRSPHAYT